MRTSVVGSYRISEVQSLDAGAYEDFALVCWELGKDLATRGGEHAVIWSPDHLGGQLMWDKANGRPKYLFQDTADFHSLRGVLDGLQCGRANAKKVSFYCSKSTWEMTYAVSDEPSDDQKKFLIPIRDLKVAGKTLGEHVASGLVDLYLLESLQPAKDWTTTLRSVQLSRLLSNVSDTCYAIGGGKATEVALACYRERSDFLCVPLAAFDGAAWVHAEEIVRPNLRRQPSGQSKTLKKIFSQLQWDMRALPAKEKVRQIAKIVDLTYNSESEYSKRQHAFVAMPFSDRPGYDSNDVYVAMKRVEALLQAEFPLFKLTRANDHHGEAFNIPTYIRNLIAVSPIFIGELTESIIHYSENTNDHEDKIGPNPNVYYEFGLADTDGKSIVLLARAGTKLPFDHHSRHVQFWKNLTEMEDKLLQALRQFLIRIGPSAAPFAAR